MISEATAALRLIGVGVVRDRRPPARRCELDSLPG